MLYKKLHIPVNLPLTEGKDIESNDFNIEIIREIQEADKLKLSLTIDLFKNYFNNNISQVIRTPLYFFFDEIIPIVYQSKQKKEGLYQLFRFTNEIVFNFFYIETLSKKQNCIQKFS